MHYCLRIELSQKNFTNQLLYQQCQKKLFKVYKDNKYNKDNKDNKDDDNDDNDCFAKKTIPLWTQHYTSDRLFLKNKSKMMKITKN